jgi:polyhydroxybutyrate depolymerase
MKTLLALILSTIAAIILDGTSKTFAQQTINKTIQFGGKERIYIVHTPPQYKPSSRLPCVLALHGGGGKAEQLAGYTGFSMLADSEGFIVVYPQGIVKRKLGFGWNDGRVITTNNEKGLDDVAFLSALVDTLGKQFGIDTKRVYATGISNGGFMSGRLACELGGKIAAVAIVAATRAINQDCTPPSPVPVMILNGTDDPLVPYNGGKMVNVKDVNATIMSTDSLVNFWRGVNKCAAKPVVKIFPDTNKRDKSTVTSFFYAGQGADVLLYKVQGGGHTWAGSGNQFLYGLIAGATNNDINASQEIWAFFKKYKVH